MVGVIVSVRVWQNLEKWAVVSQCECRTRVTRVVVKVHAPKRNHQDDLYTALYATSRSVIYILNNIL